METRPFGQSQYKFTGLRVKELTGCAYKFSLLLPITQNGTVIFSPEEEEELRILFTEDFEGYTCSRGVTHPLWIGGYTDKSGVRVVNEHTSFGVYSKQSNVAIRYFMELNNNFVKYSQNTITQRINGYKGEEKILIELMTVRLL